MIEGLKLRVTTAELKRHCEDRSAYHAQRANEKQAELPGLKEAMERIHAQGMSATSVSHMSKLGNYRMDADDPIRDLEEDVQQHQNKVLVFGFFAQHLFDDDYTLMENDLIRLEILKS